MLKQKYIMQKEDDCVESWVSWVLFGIGLMRIERMSKHLVVPCGRLYRLSLFG